MSASTTRRDLMANAIVDCATALFDERGFSETSLQDIADALNEWERSPSSAKRT